MVRIVPGWVTPSAALHAMTVAKGPFRWWGVVIGRWFIGFMRCTKEDGA